MNSKIRMRFSENRICSVPVEKILDNPAQPRIRFDSDAIDSLARSIKQNGILQPLCVRRTQNSCYILISGERRLRAAKQIPLFKVPCIVLSADDEQAAALSLIENLQREDLDCFETAKGIRSFLDSYKLTQSQAAEMLSMSQPALCNKLRLLKLDEMQIDRIRACGMGERHARALLKIEGNEKRERLLNRMIAEGMTAAQAEQAANEYIGISSEKTASGNNEPQNPVKKDSVSVKTSAIGDIRLISNTVGRVVNTIRRLGLCAQCEKNENEQTVEYHITVSKTGRSFLEINDEDKKPNYRKTAFLSEPDINYENEDKSLSVISPGGDTPGTEDVLFSEYPPESSQLCLMCAFNNAEDNDKKKVIPLDNIPHPGGIA